MATVVETRLQARFKLWDKDGDGKIGLADLQAEANRIVQALGATGSSASGLVSTYSAMFPDASKLTGVLGGAGGLVGGLTGAVTSAVTVDVGQFTTLANTLMISAGDAGFNAVLAPTINAIAKLLDTDGDGKIQAPEFRSWYGAIGLGQPAADAAFGAIDTDGDGSVSVQEIVNAVRDFHSGKSNAPLLG